MTQGRVSWQFAWHCALCSTYLAIEPCLATVTFTIELWWLTALHQQNVIASALRVKLTTPAETRWDSNHERVPHTPAAFIVCHGLIPGICKYMCSSEGVSGPLLWIGLLTRWSTFLNWSFSIELNSREKNAFEIHWKVLIQTPCKM